MHLKWNCIILQIYSYIKIIFKKTKMPLITFILCIPRMFIKLKFIVKRLYNIASSNKYVKFSSLHITYFRNYNCFWPPCIVYCICKSVQTSLHAQTLSQNYANFLVYKNSPWNLRNGKFTNSKSRWDLGFLFRFARITWRNYALKCI